ncbi:hypothetical protein R3P38DRAFT_3195454 [Favolaschia claudopus]|uniref:Uncharacterized protein n=1 Tax=Favolaschia claudopus TaxID=2862362 RepID=A0AAW0BCD5_9AGAR
MPSTFYLDALHFTWLPQTFYLDAIDIRAKFLFLPECRPHLDGNASSSLCLSPSLPRPLPSPPPPASPPPVPQLPPPPLYTPVLELGDAATARLNSAYRRGARRHPTINRQQLRSSLPPPPPPATRSPTAARPSSLHVPSLAASPPFAAANPAAPPPSANASKPDLPSLLVRPANPPSTIPVSDRLPSPPLPLPNLVIFLVIRTPTPPSLALPPTTPSSLFCRTSASSSASPQLRPSKPTPAICARARSTSFFHPFSFPGTSVNQSIVISLSSTAVLARRPPVSRARPRYVCSMRPPTASARFALPLSAPYAFTPKIFPIHLQPLIQTILRRLDLPPLQLAADTAIHVLRGCRYADAPSIPAVCVKPPATPLFSAPPPRLIAATLFSAGTLSLHCLSHAPHSRTPRRFAVALALLFTAPLFPPLPTPDAAALTSDSPKTCPINQNNFTTLFIHTVVYLEIEGTTGFNRAGGYQSVMTFCSLFPLLLLLPPSLIASAARKRQPVLQCLNHTEAPEHFFRPSPSTSHPSPPCIPRLHQLRTISSIPRNHGSPLTPRRVRQTAHYSDPPRPYPKPSGVPRISHDSRHPLLASNIEPHVYYALPQQPLPLVASVSNPRPLNATLTTERRYCDPLTLNDHDAGLNALKSPAATSPLPPTMSPALSSCVHAGFSNSFDASSPRQPAFVMINHCRYQTSLPPPPPPTTIPPALRKNNNAFRRALSRSTYDPFWRLSSAAPPRFTTNTA